MPQYPFWGAGGETGSGFGRLSLEGVQMSRLWRWLWSLVVALTLVVGLAPTSLATPGLVVPGVITVPGSSGSVERVLRFPADSTRSEFVAASRASFTAYRVAPGIAVANRAIIDGSTGLPDASSTWGDVLPDAQVQTQVNDVVAMITRIRATNAGASVIDAIAAASPLPGGVANQWRDWSSGSDSGVSDIHLVIFPTQPQTVDAATVVALSSRDRASGIGTDTFMVFNTRIASTYYDSSTGVLRGIDPTVGFAHELIHVAHYLVGGISDSVTVDLPLPVFLSKTPENPAPSSPVRFESDKMALEELLTHGGPLGLAAAQPLIAKLPGHAGYANTRENPFLTASVNAAISAQNANRALRLDRIIEAREQLSSENPTEVAITAALRVVARPEYVSGVSARGAAGYTYVTPTFQLVAGVGPTDIVAADLEAPAKSRRLTAVGGPSTPPACTCSCFGFSSLTCRFDSATGSPLTAAEFAALVKKAAELAAASVVVFPVDSAILSPSGLSLSSSSLWGAQQGRAGVGGAQFSAQTDSDYRRWNYVPSSKTAGWGQIMNKTSGGCLRVGDEWSAVSAVEVAPCNSVNSYWAVYQVDAGKKVQLMNASTRSCLRLVVGLFGMSWGGLGDCTKADTKLTLAPATGAKVESMDQVPDIGNLLVGQASGNCVQVASTVSAGLTLQKCDSSSVRQLWSFYPETGIVTISSSDSGSGVKPVLCLIAPGGTASGVAVTVGVCTGSASQKWSYSSKGWFVNQGNKQCLAVANAATSIGSGIVQNVCGAANSQVWNMPGVLLANAPVRLSGVLTKAGMVLDSLYNQVVVNTPSNAVTQEVLYQQVPGKAYGYLMRSGQDQMGYATTGLCMQRTQLGDVNSTWAVCDLSLASQQWTLFTRVDGTVMFKSVAAPNECVDLFWNREVDGSAVGSYTCNGRLNQLWRVLPITPELPIVDNAPTKPAPSTPTK